MGQLPTARDLTFTSLIPSRMLVSSAISSSLRIGGTSLSVLPVTDAWMVSRRLPFGHSSATQIVPSIRPASSHNSSRSPFSILLTHSLAPRRLRAAARVSARAASKLICLQLQCSSIGCSPWCGLMMYPGILEKRVCRPKGSSQSRTNRSMKTAFPRQIGLRQSGLGSAVNRPSGLKLIALTQGVTAVVTEK